MTKAIAVQCKAIAKQTGKQCKRKAIPGGEVCRYDGGSARQVQVKAAIRAEVLNWGLGDSHVDPGEVLLRLVTQSAARAELYARLLQEAFDAAERLKEAHERGTNIEALGWSTLSNWKSSAFRKTRRMSNLRASYRTRRRSRAATG